MRIDYFDELDEFFLQIEMISFLFDSPLLISFFLLVIFYT